MSRPSTAMDMVTAVREAQRELVAMAASGAIPPTVKTFSELHDHMDANELGGLTDEASGVDWSLDHMNLVQNTIDSWLRRGKLRKAAA